MPKVKNGYSLVQIYKYFKKQEKKEAITERQFKDIVVLFNKKLSSTILEGGEIKLPYGLAIMRIKKILYDHVTPSFDYGTYNKTGKKLYHLNEHSEGFRAKWYWNKANVWIQGKRVFSFKATWTNKRALSKVMQTDGGHKRYME